MEFRGIVDTLAHLFGEFKEQIKETTVPLVGVGVGIPGIVDTEKGIIVKATSFNCYDLEYSINLEAIFSVPVLIDNDANCCAWGQLERNKGTELQNFLTIIWKLHRKEGDLAPEEIEIGMGIVINGEVYYGSGSSAGELPEDLISREQGNIYKLKDSRWTINERALENYLKGLFHYLIPLFYVFSPQEIIFGGHFVQFRDQVENILDDVNFHISFSTENNPDTAFGAASMFLEKLFQPPEMLDIKNNKDPQWDDIFLSIENYRREL